MKGHPQQPRLTAGPPSAGLHAAVARTDGHPTGWNGMFEALPDHSGVPSDLQRLLDASVNLEERVCGLTPLLYAARAGNTKGVKLLLERSADPEAVATDRVKSPWSAIHCAALRGDTDMLAHLTKRGCDVNARAMHNVTPLHIACYNARLDAVASLLAQGADMHAQDEDGYTPLDDAVDRQAYARLAFNCACTRRARLKYDSLKYLDSIVQLLQKIQPMAAAEGAAHARGAWQHLLSREFCEAAERGDIAALARLKCRGADVDARDVDGATAMHLVCEEGHTSALAWLLDAGADLHGRNNCGDTPLHSSAHCGRVDTTLALLSRGADPEATNRFGVTPRVGAARRRQGNWRAVQVLLDATVLTRRVLPFCHKQGDAVDGAQSPKVGQGMDASGRTQRGTVLAHSKFDQQS